MNKHPHEEVILAYYRGEQIEWRFCDDEKWRQVSVYRSNKPGMEICPSFDYDVQYRIKPEPTFKLELTKNEVEAMWALFGTPSHPVNLSDTLKSIGRKLNAAEYTE